MKKFIIFMMAVMFVSTLSLVGMGNAAQQATPAGEQLVLSGMIDENSQFVDDKGEIFNLASNEKSMEVKSMNGMKVEIRGTVMEEEGKKTIEVTDYNILK